jgi:hypothetical protein
MLTIPTCDETPLRLVNQALPPSIAGQATSVLPPPEILHAESVVVSGEQNVGLAHRLLAQRLPSEPLTELVLRPGHVPVGRADHHAIKLDRQRQAVLVRVCEADVLVPARDLQGILHADHGFVVPVVARSRCAVAAHLTVVARDHQHQHALGQVREHGEEVQQQPAHDAKLPGTPM